jgi:hypothetical protein
MSDWVDLQVECTRCHHTFVDRSVDGMGVTWNPLIREAILEGMLNAFTCPACGNVFLLEKQFLYSDLERLHFLLVQPRAYVVSWPSAERDIDLLYQRHIVNEPTGVLFTAEHHRRFKVRAVFGYEHLREKLLLWDAELDDRLVEIAKLRILRERPQLVQQGYVRMFVTAVDRKALTLSFLATEPSGANPLEIDCHLARLAEMEPMRPVLEDTYPDLFRKGFVDIRRFVGNDKA